MDDQQEEHHDLQHMLQGITVPWSQGNEHRLQSQGQCLYLG